MGPPRWHRLGVNSNFQKLEEQFEKKHWKNKSFQNKKIKKSEKNGRNFFC